MASKSPDFAQNGHNPSVYPSLDGSGFDAMLLYRRGYINHPRRRFGVDWQCVICGFPRHVHC